ncbi:P-loop containing nucleoside triphosphate hydrolase protein [Parathielavia appendiculata]|uniref:P-loop containing nucleoside triphosphate hydrolase protein n=1 Tax=Parathielavia appendiculata TaxID=2587402 RepID=A0AAN6U9G8_9PEZI|nr:P-loop containing nucleoside triphosphate hydrolase protein [Parathielavia appendiculata]
MSVFTFDPDPPRVASPWLRPGGAEKSATPGRLARRKGPVGVGLLSDYGVTKLEPEPQNGPTEYKLHLLLRPRRKYERISTATRLCGSTQSRQPFDPRMLKSAPVSPGPSITSTQTRQDRLEHLTTQLLWRLQQSCPYHASTATPALVIPQLPEESEALNAPVKLGKLLPGLEASRGALYEIGVADDGTLAGLTEDEMDESLTTLRIMAASLGCNVEVLRRLAVGECEWVESNGAEDSAGPDFEGVSHQAKLWVAEALVTPDLRPKDDAQSPAKTSAGAARSAETLPDAKQGPLTTDQLRVTLTGPTTSGKSTLLGTLSTGNLDNGRGKGRLGLLKHLHEVASGITSSVTQELVGYNGGDIINYAHSGVESWIDIHDFAKDGRLVYMVDSAGHPRYRRTILRGIIGWAPHWTLLCIAADSAEFTSTTGATSAALDVLGRNGVGVDLASAHLDLCLRLGLPLVVVITKLDLANKSSLSTTLSKILSSVKRAGRVPKMVKGGSVQSDSDRVSEFDKEAVREALDSMMMKDDPASVVPILLTSAVDGRGIGALHALLQGLPLPPTPTSHDYIGAALNPEQPACLFHIEDKFSLPASYSLAISDADQQTDLGTVVAGYLRFGSLSIGDKVVVGPFPSDEDDFHGTPPDERGGVANSYGLSVSHPSSGELSRIASKNAVTASATSGEWHIASIVSIRNLRLPVQTLTAGQVGSIGMVFDPPPTPKHNENANSSAVGQASTVTKTPRLRKGMVLAVPSQHMVSSGLSLQAVSGLTAVFDKDNQGVGSLTVGSLVNVYVASVRSAARVLRVSRMREAEDGGGGKVAADLMDDLFGLAGDMDVESTQVPDLAVDGSVEVQLELLSTREWIELGSRILVLEGGSKDRSGLEGFVGKIVEIVE